MDDDDDDFDFFTRKPSNPSKPRTMRRAKSSSIPHATATPKGSTPAPALASVHEPSSSTSKSPVNMTEVLKYASSSASNSDEDVRSSSGDEKTYGRKRLKSKKRTTPALPSWSRKERSTSAIALGSESESELPPKPATISKIDVGTEESTNPTRSREVSLTPPPEPSHEKLAAARALVEHLRASHSKRSVPSTANGTTSHSVIFSPGKRALADAEDLDAMSEDMVNWDPEVAKRYRGDNAKEIRERAKKEQELKRQMRLERNRLRVPLQQSAPDPIEMGKGDMRVSTRGAAFSRTVSAPNPASSSSALRDTSIVPTAILTLDAGEDSDDSIKLVSRTSAIKPRLGDGKNAAAAIALSDSDDEDAAAAVRSSNGEAAAEPDSQAEDDEQGELMDLTLSSSIGSIPVSVRSTTQLSSIVAHFVKTCRAEARPIKQRLADTVDVKRIKIRFDGELFDPNTKSKSKKGRIVSDLDIEDGDQVEIVW